MKNVAFCPHCRTELNVQPEWQGMELDCPVCHRRFVCQIAPPQGMAAVQPQAPMPVDNGAQFNVSSSGSPAAIIVAIAALLVAACSLVYALFFTGFDLPEVDFKKDPADAVKEYLRYEIAGRSLCSYDFRKNGKEVLKSFEVTDTKTNGNYAVVFYSLKRKTKTLKKAAWLKKNEDGYWQEASKSDAKKDVPESWMEEREKDIDKWTDKSDSLRDLMK